MLGTTIAVWSLLMSLIMVFVWCRTAPPKYNGDAEERMRVRAGSKR